MSASLVGSEMCIRDRATAAPPTAAGGLRRRLCPPGRVGGRYVPDPRCNPCLLYTSDAADDM
eukprot:6014292-Alexandrium_andersonii.AAC.1